MASSNQNPSQLAADEDPIRALIQQYELVKLYDAQKAAFFDEVVQRLQLAWERPSSDRIESTKTHQKPPKENGVGHSEREPFIVVLIDGNEIIFRNRFLNEGDRGGRLAAQALYQGINEYAFSTFDDLPSDTKLVVRIWIDLDDFSNICLRAGIVDNANRIKSFVRGFCQDRSLFDLVDVGMHGQAVVFDKMEENLKIYAFDPCCKHVFFGCEDGEVYGRILKPVVNSHGAKGRVTLVSGMSPDRHLKALDLMQCQMGDIFRNTEMNKTNDFVADLAPLPTHLLERTPPVSSPASRSNSRAKERTYSTVLEHSREASLASSNSNDMAQIKPKVTSWAMAAQKGASVKSPPPKLQKDSVMTSGIRRNRKGQRIDPPTPEYKKDEVNRLKKMKLCNAHYLRQDCTFPDGKCTHDHSSKLNKSELETLKLVARMSACIHDSECDDPKCIYGHRCPFPEVRDGSMRGKACINGENCRFPPHMHNMDTAIVRVVKIP